MFGYSWAGCPILVCRTAERRSASIGIIKPGYVFPIPPHSTVTNGLGHLPRMLCDGGGRITY
ncbi:hypothetical protein uvFWCGRAMDCOMC429_020 [Freshwater phage uvFW-CGR-AMD-COM-C429]|nr:hypothetical protein uvFWCGRAMDCOMC429_020 [Freshwater phage uvFW-CGR-AMD-COM-C429]